MKSYNLDYLLEDDNTIRNAIINCCNAKKRKKIKVIINIT